MQMVLPPGWEARHRFSGSREFEGLLKRSLPKVNLGIERTQGHQTQVDRVATECSSYLCSAVQENQAWCGVMALKSRAWLCCATAKSRACLSGAVSTVRAWLGSVAMESRAWPGGVGMESKDKLLVMASESRAWPGCWTPDGSVRMASAAQLKLWRRCLQSLKP